MSDIKIPKIIHQIWLGGTVMPDHCKQFVKEMKAMHPEWEHHLWGNEIFTEIYKDDPFLQEFISDPALYKWAFIADRVRMLLLRDYGGIYCDVDAKPIQSFNLILDKLILKCILLINQSVLRLSRIYIGQIHSVWKFDFRFHSVR
jgi:mannosyltransferase OCH1-like enzyme